MDKSHVIGGDVIQKIEEALASGGNWIAYNDSSFYLDTENIDLFKNKYDAIRFAASHNTDEVNYKILYASSPADLYRQLPYGSTNEIRLKDNDQLTTISNENYSSQIKNNVMNQENLTFLTDQIRNHGFGDKKNELEKFLNLGTPEFIMTHKSEYNNQKMESALHFKRGDQSDRYFFNSHEDTMKKSAQVPEDRTQRFNLHEYKGATAKMAFNLLFPKGPVNINLFEHIKENVPWSELNLKEKMPNGNFRIITHPAFDLQEKLARYPINELGDEVKKENLTKSLQRGNIQSVTIDRPTGPETMVLKVNAKDQAVDVFNKNGEKMNEIIAKEMTEQKGLQKSETLEQKLPDTNQSINGSKGQEQKQGKNEELKAEVKHEVKNSNEQTDKKKDKSKGSDKFEDTKPTSKKSKVERIKNLLPQKEATGKKRGLSVK